MDLRRTSAIQGTFIGGKQTRMLLNIRAAVNVSRKRLLTIVAKKLLTNDSVSCGRRRHV
jgi:hypothetical protein